MVHFFKDTLKAFDYFKNKQKSVWRNAKVYAKVYIFWKFIKNFIQRVKIKTLRKLKNTLFFRDSHLIAFFLSIHDFYTNWSTRFFSLKLCVGFSIFNSVRFLSKFTSFFLIRQPWGVNTPFKWFYFPSYIFAFLQMFSFPSNIFCFLSNIFGFSLSIFCFSSNIFVSLQKNLFRFHFFTFFQTFLYFNYYCFSLKPFSFCFFFHLFLSLLSFCKRSI